MLKLKMSRITLCGDGVSEAGERRKWQRFEKERIERERQAVWRAKVSGHNIVKKGRFL